MKNIIKAKVDKLSDVRHNLIGLQTSLKCLEIKVQKIIEELLEAVDEKDKGT